jgi:leucyl-tRNA synthetase
MGYAPTEEPFKKLINQGMILGMSAFVYVLRENNKLFVIPKSLYKEICEEAKITPLGENYVNPEDFDWNNVMDLLMKGELKSQFVQPIHIDLSVINDITNELDIEAFRNHPLYTEYRNAEFVLENGKYIVGREVEKMSKSKYNVVNPDDICNEYGADTLRLYEMFLGPLEQAKPWNTAGITGVFGFLKKLWRLYFDDNGSIVTNNEPSKDSLKTLHKTIKKVAEDIENFSFNTSVSQFMICVNELSTQNCHERAVLEPLAIILSPYAPHIAEELWKQLGHEGSISTVAFPVFDAQHLVERDKEYPVSFNGKMKFTINLPLNLTVAQIEEVIMKDERTIKQLAGNTPKKVIIVPGKVINLVG